MSLLLKHKSFILGALTTSITWIILLILYNKLNFDKPPINAPNDPSAVVNTKLPVETWRSKSSITKQIGQIQSMEEKLKRDAGYETHSFNVLASDRIGLSRDIPDTRDSKCNQLKYNIPSNNASISVIICFYNEHLKTLLRTVNSILQRTPTEILLEILLIDDFSNLQGDNENLFDEMNNLDRENKVKILRNSKRQGLIRSRVFGARLAKGDILVFLDSHTEVNEMWCEPLIAPIIANHTIVTIPIVDLINPDTFEYSSSPIVKGGFNFGLHFKWDPLLKNSTDATDLIKTPTMPGGLFAVNRDYFREMGEFDIGMDIWGGENLEISFRMWMCGGSMFIVPCSRIGHVFRRRRPYGSPTKEDTMLRNNLRLAHVWLDNYQEYFYKTFKYRPKVDYGDVRSRIELRKRLNCHTFEWYHKNIYPDMQIPGNKSIYSVEPVVQPWYLRKRNYVKSFIIQNENHLCLVNLNKMGKESIKKGDALTLQKCLGKPNQKWYLTDKNELLLNQLLCLEARFLKGGTTSTFLSKCHETGADQEWTLLDNNESQFTTIYNKAAGLCLLPTNGKVGDVIDTGICGGDEKSAVWKLIYD